ncbi:hypothetical protein BLNAU_10377 [Blattamonas nauphoetae]|uniref:t-SNARE coiled-coil homology domain-containing protein n=1 Tax=Blattamonas nauphoetae TaxID=2049346 RepID=A0ABQ9XTB6_9EUKA|nr:hypothetical protein BLNAU_10377 [Blattamonas nauphoetae]
MDVNMGDLDGYGKLKDNTYALNEGVLCISNNSPLGTSIIDDAIRTTSDTVDIATGTLNEMGRQRETLDHARGVNRDIGADLGRGARLLRGMSRRARQNQFILVCIIIAIVAVIGLIIFLIIKNIYDKAHPKVTPSVKTFHSLDR